MINIDMSNGLECGGFHYRVLSGKAMSDELKAMGEYGSCNTLLQVIRIDNQISEERTSHTFIHEIIEIINDLSELGLDHHTITVLSKSFHQTMESVGVRLGISGDNQ